MQRTSIVGLAMTALLCCWPVALFSDPPSTLDRATHRGLRVDQSLAELVKRIGASRVDASSRSDADLPALTWLIDVSDGLLRAKLLDQIAASIDARFADLPARHTVWQAGRLQPVLRAATDRARVKAALLSLKQRAEGGAQDLCRQLSQAARRMPAAKLRALIVLSLGNSDTEAEIEATRTQLRKAGIRLFAMLPSARYADAYWLKRTKAAAGLGLRLAGAAAPRIEFPWGFFARREDPHEHVSSGFAPYAFNRLALGSGGALLLIRSAPDPTPSHRRRTFCKRVRCSLCEGRHDCGATYSPARLALLAPEHSSREAYDALMRKTPAARVMRRAWATCHQLGLIAGPPPRTSDDTLRPSTRQGASIARGSQHFPWSMETFTTYARRAPALRLGLDAPLAGLARVPRQGDSAITRRAVAAADALRAVLLVTRFNLDQIRRYAERVRELRKMEGRSPIEQSTVVVHRCHHAACGLGPWQIEASSVPLCHGLAPLREIRWLGGAEADAEIASLCEAIAPMVRRYRGTPWELVISRTTLLRLHLSRRWNCQRIEGGGGGGGGRSKPSDGPPPRPERRGPPERTGRDGGERTK